MPFFKFFKSSQTGTKHIGDTGSDAASTTTAATLISDQKILSAGQGNNPEDALSFLYSKISIGGNTGMSCQNKI
ncbi:hypothetical protein EC988_004952 [Linderina pennispora]|nr:hypothetical protein EC988_004952 [Linderina pennispora]